MAIAIIVIISVLLILGLLFIIGTVKTIGAYEEMYRERDDAEQEEYLREWREKRNKKKER